MTRTAWARLTKNLLRTQRQLCTKAKATPTVSNTTPTLTYISPKMKEEILELHEEDAERWTETTLSARFAAPRPNVSGLLKLAKIRQRRHRTIADLETAQREQVESLRDRAYKEWISLPSAPTRSWKSGMPSASPGRDLRIEDVTKQTLDQKDVQTASDNPDGHDQASAEGDAEADQTEAPKHVAEISEWAHFIERNCEQMELDAVRKTTFSFIEIGKNQSLRRAVWLREGSTGKLRMASDDERRLLTEQVKVRDSPAFLPTP